MSKFHWSKHPQTAAVASMLKPHLKDGTESDWEAACRDLQSEFSDTEAHQILARVLSACEVLIPLSPPPSGYSGDPAAQKAWAADRKRRRAAMARIRKIKRWCQSNEFVNGWIQSGRDQTVESAITAPLHRRGPRPNPFLPHLLLGVRHVKPRKLIVLDDVLAKLCLCFDPATERAEYKIVKEARKKLHRAIGPNVPVRLLVNSDNSAITAARAFFRSCGIRVLEQDMRRVPGAAPFAILIDHERLDGFDRKKVKTLLRKHHIAGG